MTEITTTAVATPATKKTSAKKEADPKVAKKTNPSANGHDDSKERAAAKTAGISLVHLRILKALKKSPNGLTYRGIEAKTGYYSVLTAQLRKESNRGGEHGESLGALGMVREEIHDIDGKDVLHFVITAKGKKTLEKAK